MEGMNDGAAGQPQDAPRTAATARPIDQFCDRVRADPSLQETLRQPDDVEPFVALVLSAARDCGLALSADDVKAAMRSRLPGIPAIIDVGERETALPPRGWFPFGAFWRNGQLYVQWTYFGAQRLTQPLYENEVQLHMRKPFNCLIRYATPITKLAEWLRLHPPLQPSGFIFHMSRCGSTLVSRMLAAQPRNVVIAEAKAIDAAVRARQMRPDMSEDQHVLWLRWMIGAFGQPRVGDERGYFIKLDALHTIALPLFARAFPEVPWIFLYREPVEVMVSHLQLPGIQALAGADPYLAGIDPSGVVDHPEDFCAQAFGRICAAALQRSGNGKSLLINFRQLPAAMETMVAPHFGLACSDQDRDAMAEAARFNAKMPDSAFTPDSDAKQRYASAALRSAAEQHVGEIYRRLEAVRAGGIS
jgi:hypothetical protein